ncbi:MAG: CPBP family glutamic-type intramembrane protease [Gemmatimonadales bacterium]
MSTTNRYQYRPVRFFGLTLVATWGSWLLAYALQSNERYAGAAGTLTTLGLLMPFVVTLLMVFGSGNRALKRDFAARLLQARRIQPRYLAVAVALPLALMAAALSLSLLIGESSDQLRLSSDEGLVGMIVLALVIAPIIEELGWRGYGVDSIRAGAGPLKTSLIFGVLWSLWHAPLTLLEGTYHHELAQMENPLYLVNFFLSVIPVAVLANWLYYRCDRSILLGILFHSVLNATAVLPDATQVTKCLVTVIYAVVTIAVVRSDRTIFGAGPRNFVTGDDANG